MFLPPPLNYACVPRFVYLYFVFVLCMQEHNLPPLVPDHQILKIPAQLIATPENTWEYFLTIKHHWKYCHSWPDIEDTCATPSYTRKYLGVFLHIKENISSWYYTTEPHKLYDGNTYGKINALQFCITLLCSEDRAKCLLNLCKIHLKAVQKCVALYQNIGEWEMAAAEVAALTHLLIAFAS